MDFIDINLVRFPSPPEWLIFFMSCAVVAMFKGSRGLS